MPNCSLRTVVAFFALTTISLAAQDVLSSKSERNQTLTHFACDYAFPHCGITSKRFLNSTRTEVLLYSASSHDAVKYLNLSENQIQTVLGNDRFYRLDSEGEEELQQMLSGEQRFKVECIALYIDACAVLDRQVMQSYLKLIANSINRIAQLRDKYMRDLVGPLNSSYFGSDASTEALGAFIVAAAKLNARFNLDVIAALDDQEKERFGRLIGQTVKCQELSSKVREQRYRYAEGLSKRPLSSEN